jgi:hypothetical protein
MILGNLNLQLHNKLSMRITELGDVLDTHLILMTSNQSIEVGDIEVEIIKPVNTSEGILNFKHSNKISHAKNVINNNSVKWLSLRILHKGKSNVIGKLIDEYRFRVYQYANEMKFTFGNDADLQNADINRQFQNIKEEYKSKILQSLFLTTGSYNLIFKVHHKEVEGMFSSRNYKALHKETDFRISEMDYNFEISLDNFLGQIMSNILFSPDRPMELIEPTMELEII